MENEEEMRLLIRSILSEGLIALNERARPTMTGDNEKTNEDADLEEKALEEKPQPQGVDKIISNTLDKIK
jgi:hypothetical protein